MSLFKWQKWKKGKILMASIRNEKGDITTDIIAINNKDNMG